MCKEAEQADELRQYQDDNRAHRPSHGRSASTERRAIPRCFRFRAARGAGRQLAAVSS